MYIEVRSARGYFPICWTRGLRCERQRAKCLALSRWMLGMSGMLRVSCKWGVGLGITTGHLQIQTFLAAVSYVLLCFHVSSYYRVVVTTSASYSGTPGFDCRPQEKPSLLKFFVVLLHLNIQTLVKIGHGCFYYLPSPINISQLSLFFAFKDTTLRDLRNIHI
jgi:hypothetical protein